MAAFEFDVKVVKNRPQTNSSAPASATLRAGAISSSDTPKPAAPRNITRQLAFAIAADVSAPSSAPAPKHADRIPNVRGPAANVSFASSGNRMLKLNEMDEKTTIIASTTFTLWWLRTNLKPSRVPRQIVGRPRSVSG